MYVKHEGLADLTPYPDTQLSVSQLTRGVGLKGGERHPLPMQTHRVSCQFPS